MKTTPILSSKVDSDDKFPFFSILESWGVNSPEFDTVVLKKLKCWPVSKKHYKPFTIEKRNGTERHLVAVDKNLKLMQQRLAVYFERAYPVSKYAHAFIPKRSKFAYELNSSPQIRPTGVITNALAHTNKKVVISIDIKDFFPNITFPRVLGLLKSKPYDLSNRQAAILASLICLPKGIDENRGLPQGAPTSPIISNLLCKKLDNQLGAFSKKNGITYTRYADDLTFSTNNLKHISTSKIVEHVTNFVERNGFNINTLKTKVMYKNQRQMVTGIVVNDGLNLPKKQVDAIRATLHNLEHNYKSVSEAVYDFWLVKGKNAYDQFVPLDFYPGGYKGRYIKSKNNGEKRNKPTSDIEFNKIYALHILGRILWYGQVVTTAVNEPYDLSKRKYISPKQHLRINKYEEMLATFYRISMKFNWPIEHIILRLANKFPNLQSLVKMNPMFLLEPVTLDANELAIKDKVNSLRSDKLEYTAFFESAPDSLKRVLRVENRSHTNFDLKNIKQCVEYGWETPTKLREVFNEFDNGKLADLFHKSSDRKGHKVVDLLKELVSFVKPRIRYFPARVKRKIIVVQKELLHLIRAEGEEVYIDLENETTVTKKASQAIRDLKFAIRLYDSDTDNLYNRVVLEAIKSSDTLELINIDKDNMNPRIYTDIDAWRESLTKVLISIKQHTHDDERVIDQKQLKPFTICFREENPLTGSPIAIEIYKANSKIPFKKKLNISEKSNSGLVNKWITGGDLQRAVRDFMPVGDIFVHGDFIDCKNITVNLTEHSYKKEKTVYHNKYGTLFISLQELRA
ncbi:reverse transcriptase family protein [Shewanella algae]|uniref:reverse transcriptase family protein n=1 Tax=Shewanella algae TaxID=38313 RepID=UPI001AAC6F0E|nr:reverse transcriptase family protein [Shewanella algae]QTE85345.1 RNA-directed DNA polymerase [Shewanella algae]